MCNKESVLCIMLPTPSEGASRCSVLLSCDCELWNSWCAAKWENQRCVLGSFWYQGNSRTTYLVEFASEHVSELAHHSQQHLLQVDVSCLLGKKQLADEAVKTYFSKSSLWSEHRDTVSIQSEKQGLHFSKLLSIAGSYLRVLELQADHPPEWCQSKLQLNHSFPTDIIASDFLLLTAGGNKHPCCACCKPRASMTI